MTHSIKKLAAGLMSIVMSAAFITGCSSKKSSSSQGKTVSAVSSEKAEASSETTTQTTTTTPTTTTTTTTTAPLMPAMTVPSINFDDISVNGNVRNLFTTSDNTLVFQTETNSTNSCFIFDPVNAKIVRSFNLPNCSEVVGVFSDGTIAVVSRQMETDLLLYPKDSDTPKEIKINTGDSNDGLIDNLNYTVVDRFSDYFYYTDLTKNDIFRIDQSGKTSTLPLDRDIQYYSDFNAETRTFCTEEFSAETLNGSIKYICSLDSGEPLSEITADSWCNCLVGPRSVSAYINSNGETVRKLDVYSIYDGKYEKSWKLPYSESITYHYTGSRDSRYLLSADVNGYSDSISSFYFIDPENGTTAELKPDQALQTTWYYACYMTEAKRWFIVYSTGLPYNATSHIMMADPTQMKFDTQLEPCESSRINNEPAVCGEKFKEIREEADKLEKEFGIYILVGDEVKNAEYGSSYKFISTEQEIESDFTYTDELQNVRLLREVLSMYPKDFFEHFKDKNGKGGLRIALVKRLESETYSDFTAAGVSYDTGCWFNIALQSMYTYDHGMFHHEMLHSVEELVYRKYPFNGDDWIKLNPYGFWYSQDFDSYANNFTTDPRTLDYVNYNEYINYDAPYFISNYSLITPMEDRATLIQKLFDCIYNDDGTYKRFGVEGISEYPHLKAKLDFLAEWTKKEFGYVYWEELLKNTAKYDEEKARSEQEYMNNTEL